MADMIITFPGGKRVDAQYRGMTIRTDQPEHSGGDGSAPVPFALFLASLGTCAGIYVLGFCEQRDLPTEGMRIIQRMERDPVEKRISKISLDIELPVGFPEKYRKAVVNVANLCAVKKHILNAPEFEITTSMAGA